MLSRLMTRREQFVVVFIAGAVILGSLVLYITNDRDAASPDALVLDSAVPAGTTGTRDGSVNDTADANATATETEPEPFRDEVTVSLVGAVVRPAVYTLDAGSRVQDLVRSAGGLLGSADASDVNLAAKLIDGTTLIIPREPVTADSGDVALARNLESAGIGNMPAYTISGWQGASSPGGSSQRGSTGQLIDLNRATQAELESLPGIGPKLAGEIIRYRTTTRFLSISDVMNVSGIGPKRYEAISGLVTVR
ncbi:MAG: ComEA family DNA-binding protein [Candidatus Hydrogenedentes bacterium]|nr:ComEA family DNA-binding protein [Candidatus Hydrogenedentota bacterium]